MTKYLNIIAILIILSSTSIYAQDASTADRPQIANPPINVETLVGNRGVMYQLIVNKKFQSIPRLGFFSVTNGTGTWEKELTADIMTQAHLTYNLYKGLDLSAGMQYTPIYSFRPVAGLIYSYASRDVLIIANPKVDLARDFANEYMALLEYKPRLNDNINFYSRVQGLYGFVPKTSDHNRSYLMLRAGVSYKEFTFGAATNFDWYGPMKHHNTNYGIFISALIF